PGRGRSPRRSTGTWGTSTPGWGWSARAAATARTTRSRGSLLRIGPMRLIASNYDGHRTTNTVELRKVSYNEGRSTDKESRAIRRAGPRTRAPQAGGDPA